MARKPYVNNPQAPLSKGERLFLENYRGAATLTDAHELTFPKQKMERSKRSVAASLLFRSICEKMGGKENVWEHLGLSMRQNAKTLNEGMEAKELKVVTVKQGQNVPDEVREYEYPDYRSRVQAARVAGALVQPPRQKAELTGADGEPLTIRFTFLRERQELDITPSPTQIANG